MVLRKEVAAVSIFSWKASQVSLVRAVVISTRSAATLFQTPRSQSRERHDEEREEVVVVREAERMSAPKTCHVQQSDSSK